MSERADETESGDADLEAEKTESYRLGMITQMNRITEELRERAGKEYATASTSVEHERARLLKTLANEYDERSDEMRDEWDDAYRSGSDE